MQRWCPPRHPLVDVESEALLPSSWRLNRACECSSFQSPLLRLVLVDGEGNDLPVGPVQGLDEFESITFAEEQAVGVDMRWTLVLAVYQGGP